MAKVKKQNNLNDLYVKPRNKTKENELEELFSKSEELSKEVFESTTKMRDFLQTLSKMYNTSFRNILLLKSQRNNVSYIAEKREFEANGYKINENEKPLKCIKFLKLDNERKFKVAEVYDISQTNQVRENKTLKKDYIEKIIKSMCDRRHINYQENDLMYNIESIISDISSNIRQEPKSSYNIDRYASQSQVEVDATRFVVLKTLSVNTKNYNLKEICKWAVDKDTNELMSCLKNIQKFANYFVKDFNSQEKIIAIDNSKSNEEEEEFE